VATIQQIDLDTSNRGQKRISLFRQLQSMNKIVIVSICSWVRAFIY